MKIIQNNAIAGISADSENLNYPATNLLDSHPKKKWMAADYTVTSVVISIKVSGKTGGLGMVGIVADSALVSISDPNGITWNNVTWDNVGWVDTPDTLDLHTTWDTSQDFASLWVEFEQFESTVNITITLYKQAGSPDVLAGGVVVAGKLDHIRGLQYPLQEGLRDYSTVRELSNGSLYYNKRDIVRTFSGRFVLERKSSFWLLMREIARKYGRVPMMMHLADISGEWTVYAGLSAMPSGSHDYPTHSSIDFELTEVL